MVDPVTGAAIAEALAEITAGMVGQSLSEAYDGRMTNSIEVDDGPQIGYGNWTTDKPSISGNTSESISEGSGETPVDAWNDYVENTPSISVSDVTGGAVSGSNVFAVAYSLMEEHPGTAQAAVKAVAPVAIPIAVAVTAIAQATGVSVDYTNLASNAKESLESVFTNAGMVYDRAKGLVTAWKDELGRILFPKTAFDDVYDVVKDWGGDHSTAYYHDGVDGVTGPFNIGVSHYSPQYGSGQTRYVTGGAYAIFRQAGTANSITGIGASSNSNDILSVQDEASGTVYTYALNRSMQYNGKTVYYFAGNGGEAFSDWSGAVNDMVAPSAGAVAWVMIYGDITPSEPMPDGASTSEASSYDPSTIPVVGNLATSYDPDTGVLGAEPLVPIHITDDPEDATGDTTDPVDPTDEDNPGVVNPPVPLPIPDTKPSNPNVPLVNPSIVDSTLVNELVEELANTVDPQAPQSSGTIPVPLLPGIIDPITGQSTFPSIIPQSGPGFIHVYNPTPAEFVAFGTWLWVTYADATIDKILNNPFDGVIGAHELYATPNHDGSDNIRSAFLTCPTTAALVTNRYSEIDCGTVIVPEFYGNYLDYSPYSQAYIYLPFIGINEVSIDDIVGHAVNIRYRVDSYSGSCIAMIFVAKGSYQNLCYQFAGSCSVEVPMAGGSQAAIKAGMMQAEAYARAAMIQAGANVVGGIGSALMGNVGGVLSSLSGIASNYAQAQAGVEAARVANKSSVQHSGQFGASHGAMGDKIPFIIIRNPIQVKVVNYNEDYGFPAHKRVIVGGCRGYLRVREVNVISPHATDEEKMAIEMALKGGVYVS